MALFSGAGFQAGVPDDNRSVYTGISREHTVNRTSRVIAAISLSSASLCAVADAGTDGVRTALEADDLRVVAQGEKIYQTYCASCHGVQLEGQPDWRQRNANGRLPAPPHDASGHTWHHADDLLFEITKYGSAVVIGDPSYQSDMPAFEQVLSDADIIAVLSFIKNTWPEEQRGWLEEVNGNRTESFASSPGKPSFFERLMK